MKNLPWGSWLIAVVVLAACGDDAGRNETDAAIDAAADAVVEADAGNDANVDVDAGDDGSVEAGVDAMVTADGGTDAAVETEGQEAYLKASNTGSNDQLGDSVAISGDTIVVGAYEEDSGATGVDRDQNNNNATGSGAAYVFARAGNTWTQQAYLKASNGWNSDAFGYSVAASGDTIVVGAPYEDSGATGINGDELDNSVVGSGAVYVFVRNGATWEQQAYIKASNPGMNDNFGFSVALEGDTLVVGAVLEGSSATGIDGDQTDDTADDSGAAYVFVRSAGSWTQQAYVKASNTGAGDRFGESVALSGNTLVVGALQEASAAIGVDGDQVSNDASNSGAAYVFVRNGSSWTQQAYLKASNTGVGDKFGGSVGVSGDVVVVGASGEDSNTTGVNGTQDNEFGLESGAAYVFVRSNNLWTQQAYLKASNGQGIDRFGTNVAVSVDTVLVGASHEDSSATGVDGNQSDEDANDSGAVYVFVRSGNEWNQPVYLKASNTGAGDNFGASVAMSGDTWVIGAIGESSNANGVNGDQANDSASAAGAAYVFRNLVP